MLTTYSGALHVRQELAAAGFSIGRGPGMGKKREGTLASPRPFAGAFSDDELKELSHHINATPYHDLSGTDSREEILQRRIDEMAALRSERA